MGAGALPRPDRPRSAGHQITKEDCLAEAVRCHLEDMLATARRLLRSEDLAWDAVQEALCALWLEAAPPLALRGWLIQAVKNRSLHALRSGRRRRYHESACACLRCLLYEDDPARKLQDREFAELVWKAVQGLPEGYRFVFEMREFLGLDYDSIAQELDVAVGTVRSRLNRARRAVRDGLQS